MSAKGAKPGARKSKRLTILLISIVKSYFSVLFFSLCSNLSIQPDRPLVPNGSRCYISIFDGLVYLWTPSFTQGGQLQPTPNPWLNCIDPTATKNFNSVSGNRSGDLCFPKSTWQQGRSVLQDFIQIVKTYKVHRCLA